MIILGPIAASENNAVGKNNDLPWHLPEDLKHFKQLTLGKTVLMGRKTFESILARLKKPLPGRKNAVITRQANYSAPKEVLVFNSFDEAVKNLAGEDVYVIGGAETVKLALPLAKKFYLTRVKGEFSGDAFLPEINWAEWKLVNEEKYADYSFLEYERTI